jgi:uncharacterized protein (TIGR02246 family)
VTGALKNVFVCAAIAVAMSCQQEPATEQGSETSPAVDATAAREAILAVDQAWEDAALAGDAAALTALYTSDAIVQAPGSPRATGSQAIQELFTGMLEYPISSVTLDTDIVEVAASGDIAYGAGTFTMSGTAADGTEWSDQGKYMEVLENVDGEWKIAADIWNSDTPPPGMESAEEAPMESAEEAPVE